MYMIYVWWVVLVLILMAWAVFQSVLVPFGQRRMQAVVRFLQFFTAILVTLLLVQQFEWLGGLFAVVALIFVMAIARLHIIHAASRGLHESYLTRLLPWISQQQWLDYFTEQVSVGKRIGLETYEELLSVIDNAHFLRSHEQRTIRSVVETRDKTLRDYMTPILSVPKINATDVIGPLLLDELHRSKQTDFAVVDDDGVITGTAQLQELIEMSHVSSSVRAVMHPNVLRMKPNVAISDAVNKMMSNHAWLCVIHDEDDIGVVTLEQLSNTLLGKPLK